MKNAVHRSSRSNRAVPALLAVGGSLAALPAAALELGEITVHSNLGQPLRASIAYALAPTESMGNSCVSIGPAAVGLPGIGPATVSVANGVINLTGATPLREPMVSVRLVVDCPYSPNLSREYMMFIDPPTYDAPRAAEAAAATSRAATPVTSVAPAPAPRAVSRPAPVADIAQGSTIRVPAGSTLGEIAQRIENRTTSLWPTVNALFEANPDAFIDNDPNKLKAGALLTIPASLGTVVATTESAPTKTIETVAVAATPAPAVDASQSNVAEQPAVEEPTAAYSAANEAVEMTGDLQPGDIIVSDNPFVEPQPAETVVIPDTQLDGPQTTSTSPNALTQIVVPKSEPTGTSSWVWWLGGAGIVALLGLFLFGRRSSTTPAPVAPSELDNTLNRRRTDTVTEEALVVEELEFNPDASYDLDDDSPTEENLVLDADLVTGSGLAGGTEVDVKQDFGFAATAEVDVELPFEPVASVTSDETDILPPPTVEESSILKNEVLPGQEDEYDMSVILDATKMPQPEEVTEHDLKAVEVQHDENMIDADSYTITREIDYEILEQDYEDELTATQALNEEIARAAIDLAERMEDSDATGESGETAVLPMASVTELDVTTEMPAANSDEVIELDATAEMPVDSNDDSEADTSTMKVESGKRG
ncbi:MAG: hypothetical protein AAFN50_10320 [Pseudomonadota bacterium]